jgi:hypothetical protein
MQEIRHFKPSTVSRRFSVVAGFYPHLRRRRPARELTGRARPAARGASGITHPREAIADPAKAIAEGLTIVTRDKRFDDYGVALLTA